MKVKTVLVFALFLTLISTLELNAGYASGGDPAYGQTSSTASVSYDHWSVLTVYETIKNLGGGVYRYSYEFRNVESKGIWHFCVWTKFNAGTSTQKTFSQLVPYGTWNANGHNITNVATEYDARNLDPTIVWVSQTWDNPYPNDPNPIAVNQYVSGFSFTANVLDTSPKYYGYEVYGSYAYPGGKLTAVGKTALKSWQYHFRISPFIDQVWINVTSQPGGLLLYGLADVPSLSNCYPAPVLGWASGTSFYMALDYRTSSGCYELGLIVGTTSTASGKLYRTMDGTTWVGPTAVTLQRLAEAEVSSVVSASIDVAPQGWPYTYKFILSPFVDRVYVHTDSQTGGTLIHGYDNLTSISPCYPAPVLGWATGNNFYMWLDFKTSGSCFELGMIVGTISTKSGKLYRTMDGTSVTGPVAVTLTPF